MKVSILDKHMKEVEVYSVDRYDILLAFMESNQTKNRSVQLQLSKIIKNIELEERKSRQYVKTINVKVAGNENLIAFLQRMA